MTSGLIFLLLISYFAQNQTLSLLKTLKILEFIFLGWFISKKVRFWTSPSTPSSGPRGQNDERSIKLSTVIFLLAATVFYESVLAVWQFFRQGSAGGLWWLLGERTFNSSTPFISQAIINGQLILRSYGTFSHPNVLGGYLAIVLPLILLFGCHCEPRFNRGVAISFRGFLRLRSLSRAVIKRDCFTSVRNDSEGSLLAMTVVGVSIFLGMIALFLSFSRTAWLVGGTGLLLIVVLRRKFFRSWYLFIIGLLVFIGIYLTIGNSVVSRFQTLEDVDKKSLVIREQLNTSALKIISDHPVFGVGLNNFLVVLPRYWQTTGAVRFYQPAHNIYLEIAAETGVVGLVLFLIFVTATVRFVILGTSKARTPESDSGQARMTLLLILSEILLLGLFDHYFYTLQQAELLFAFILGLAWTKKEKI